MSLDVDAIERLLGSLTAELRLLRQQRDEVLALCDDSDASEFPEVRGDLHTFSIRAVYSGTGAGGG